MKIRTKTFVTVVLTILVLIWILYAISTNIIRAGFSQIEQQAARANVDRATEGIWDQARKLSDSIRDWSHWDDAYNFIQDGNEEFRATNLVDNVFTSLNINILIFIKPNGEIFYSRGYDFLNKLSLPIPLDLEAHLKNNPSLWQHTDPKEIYKGLILLPANTNKLLLASSPILKSKGEGESAGTLIMGRYLDQPVLNILSADQKLSLAIFRVRDPQLPQDFLGTLDILANNQPINHEFTVFGDFDAKPLSLEDRERALKLFPVLLLEEDRIAAYSLLRDIYGQPAMILRADMPRTVYREGERSLKVFFLFLGLAGLVFSITTMVLLERIVLSRLAKLNQEVKQITANQDLHLRVKLRGNDEFGSLAQGINTMLNALSESQERYQSIFENASEGIFQSTIEGKYLSVNLALAKIYGYESIEDLISSVETIARQVYVDPQRRREYIIEMDRHSKVFRFESQVYRQDGSIVWISENARAVRDQQGSLLYYEGTIVDITARKIAEEGLRYQQEQSEQLLLNILPLPIAQRLKMHEETIADYFPDVTVLFADLVGFTEIAAQTEAVELVQLLNAIFSAFDDLTEYHQLEKIKTIGDAYMVVGGLPQHRDDHAEAIANMAIAMLLVVAEYNRIHSSHLSIRIGINTGAVVAGVIGTKKFIYDLWGDTVNIASRMESQGLPGCIQVTAQTYEILKDKYNFEYRGTLKIKGKGDMDTYLLQRF
jgi:PAS domain S-box-containing protein